MTSQANIIQAEIKKNLQLIREQVQALCKAMDSKSEQQQSVLKAFEIADRHKADYLRCGGKLVMAVRAYVESLPERQLFNRENLKRELNELPEIAPKVQGLRVTLSDMVARGELEAIGKGESTCYRRGPCLRVMSNNKHVLRD